MREGKAGNQEGTKRQYLTLKEEQLFAGLPLVTSRQLKGCLVDWESCYNCPEIRGPEPGQWSQGRGDQCEWHL